MVNKTSAFDRVKEVNLRSYGMRQDGPDHAINSRCQSDPVRLCKQETYGALYTMLIKT